MKKYRVELSDEEHAALQRLIRRGRRGETSARKRARARIHDGAFVVVHPLADASGGVLRRRALH